MSFKSRYLIKKTATTITSITHALNTPPRVTGRTLDPWSGLSGSAIDINKHLDHIGFDKMHEIQILVCKLSNFWTVLLIGKRFSNSGQVDIQPTYVAAFTKIGACTLTGSVKSVTCLIDTVWSTGVLAVFSIWIIACWKRIKVLLLEEKQSKFANNFKLTVILNEVFKNTHVALIFLKLECLIHLSVFTNLLKHYYVLVIVCSLTRNKSINTKTTVGSTPTCRTTACTVSMCACLAIFGASMWTIFAVTSVFAG